MNIPESAIKAGESLFSCDCGYTDKKHKLNLARRSVPESILREVENGCTIETLERIAADFPICKYKTQITIHGKFPPLLIDRIGGYKNLVRNKNKSVGVRWSAIDHEKRARLFRIAHICADWGIVENSTAFFLEKYEVVRSQEELDATLQKYRAEAERINAAQSLFKGGCDILKASYWGRVYIILRLTINSFYERDFDALSRAICGMDQETIWHTVKAHEEKRRAENEEWERKMEERRIEWERKRKAEAERKAAYMANLQLPFPAEYGEHKVKKGDIYAVVVHTNRYDSDSDFTVKYYTVQKRIGRCYLYPCDEHGTITEGTHGKYRREPTIKAYRKVA